MSTEEEYLDRLLAQAMQPKKLNNDKDAAADKVIITEAPVSVSSGKGARGPKGNSVKNPKGNKDFSLDDVDAEQLAKEIADFEADADASILPGNSELSEEALPEADAAPAGAGAEPSEETGFAENEPADEIQDIAPVQDTENKEFSEEALLAALNETGPAGGEIDALFETAPEAETDAESVAEIDASPEAEIESASEAVPEASFDATELSELDAAPEASPEASFDAAELSELDAAFGDETAQEADFGTEEVAEVAPNADLGAASELETDAESVAGIDASHDAEIESAPEASPEASFDAAELSELDAAFGDETAQEADFGTEEVAEVAPNADLGAASELETDAESVAGIDASHDAEIESAPEASPEASFDEAELSELDAALEASPEASFDEAELSELDAAFGDETAQEADADPVGSEIDTDDLPDANMESADSVDSDVEVAGQNDAADTLDMADLSDASDMDELASMDLDDIEARMAEAEAAGDEEIQIPGADGDITDILGAMEGLDPGLADVKEVLDKSDQNIAVDAGLFDEPDIPDPLAALEDEAESDAEADASTKSGKKGKKEKKKKGGFFSKLFKKKKKDDGKAGQNEENFPDEDELDLASKLDPDDFVQEDISDRPREESDEAVAAMFSGLDSIFSDGGNGAQTHEGGSEGDIPSVDESSFGEAAIGEPSIGAPSSDDAVSEEPDAEDKPKKSGGSGGGSSLADEGADGEDKGKKKKAKKDNIFKRIFATLLEDPDEDLGAVPEEQETKLSEENKQILNELDGEEEKPKKEKKKKQPKEKKEKKPKVKKPKKEKEKKPEEPGVKIPKKYKIRTFMVAASVLAAILVLTVLVPSANVMSSARAAYYDKNYKDAFLFMYGKDLNESDKLIYDRSKTIILLDRKYESYTQYKAMGMRDKALDSLLQGLVRYDALKDTATELDVIDTLDATKENILAALWDEYQISEEEAAEILKYSPADYSGKIKASAEMLPYTTIEEQVSSLYGYPENTDDGGSVEPAVPDDAGNDNGEEELYPDLLPEEQEHIESNNNAENPDIPEDTPADTDQSRREGYGEKEDGTNVPVEIESEQF